MRSAGIRRRHHDPGAAGADCRAGPGQGSCRYGLARNQARLGAVCRHREEADFESRMLPIRFLESAVKGEVHRRRGAPGYPRNVPMHHLEASTCPRSVTPSGRNAPNVRPEPDSVEKGIAVAVAGCGSRRLTTGVRGATVPAYAQVAGNGLGGVISLASLRRF
jgi:hypothetical protein